MSNLAKMKETYVLAGLNPPSFVLETLSYLTYTGSKAYGVSNENSDNDLVGFCVPPVFVLFPHYSGVMPGFDKYSPFEQWHQPKVQDFNGKIWDFTVYNIVKYFRLTLDGNPNMIDTLFTADDLIFDCDEIGKHVRANRHIFINMKLYDRFVGYAKCQLPRVANPNKLGNDSRMQSFIKYGYDTKAVYHLFRLLLECKQLLKTGEMDLQINSGFLTKVRTGSYSVDQLNGMLLEYLNDLEEAKLHSKLPIEPREKEVKKLLIECLEMQYGTVPGGNW